MYTFNLFKPFLRLNLATTKTTSLAQYLKSPESDEPEKVFFKTELYCNDLHNNFFYLNMYQIEHQLSTRIIHLYSHNCSHFTYHHIRTYPIIYTFVFDILIDISCTLICKLTFTKLLLNSDILNIYLKHHLFILYCKMLHEYYLLLN